MTAGPARTLPPSGIAPGTRAEERGRRVRRILKILFFFSFFFCSDASRPLKFAVSPLRGRALRRGGSLPAPPPPFFFLFAICVGCGLGSGRWTLKCRLFALSCLFPSGDRAFCLFGDREILSRWRELREIFQKVPLTVGQRLHVASLLWGLGRGPSAGRSLRGSLPRRESRAVVPGLKSKSK